jgi:hypothetical protein
MGLRLMAGKANVMLMVVIIVVEWCFAVVLAFCLVASKAAVIGGLAFWW